MAKAKLADGTVFDLTGAKVSPGDGELFAAIVSGGVVGGTVSVTHATGVHSPLPIPFLGQYFSTPPLTQSLPLDKALNLLDLAANGLGAVPGVGPQMVAGAHVSITILKALISKLG